MIEIPKQLQNFNFILLGKEKKPIEKKGWQKRIRRINDTSFQKHINKEKNYGVQSNNSSVIINEEAYFLVIVDFDKRKFQDKVISQFPETFTTTSGSPKNCVHLWLASDNNKPFKIKDEKGEMLSDMIGAGNYVVAPGSRHSSGSIYSVVKDIPIAFVPYAEIESILKPHDKSPKKTEKLQKQFTPRKVSDDISQKIFDSVSMESVLQELNIDTSKNPTNCLFHSSVGGKCLSWNKDVAHCFHCDNSWNKFSLVRQAKKLSNKETFEWFAEKAGMSEELKKSREEFTHKEAILTRRGQVEEFWQRQPFFYDKSKIFYLWNDDLKKWEISDEVDFLNSIREKLGLDTIDTKTRTELIEGFKQVGRKHTPKKIEKEWVQFKNKIYSGKTGEFLFEATPEYFVKNPIPYNLGNSEETPTIDKLFVDWVGKENSIRLYELFAYTITIDRFMQRIFALCGGGSNGKGTCIHLLRKFIGKDNMIASEMREIAEGRFETAALYGKLLCVMGEISYDDLRNTNQLKKIAGEDIMRFEFKGKTPFADENTAVCVCLTNSLPTTPDKTIGFYRKWNIIDFPNQFPELKEDLIGKIPEVEFENLTLKCLKILKRLYENSKFTNEGDFDERIKRYEERSNPVMRFIEEYCKEENGKNTSLREFTNKCNEILKTRHLRVLTASQIGKILRNEGFIIGNIPADGTSVSSIKNLIILNILNISQSQFDSHT